MKATYVSGSEFQSSTAFKRTPPLSHAESSSVYVSTTATTIPLNKLTSPGFIARDILMGKSGPDPKLGEPAPSRNPAWPVRLLSAFRSVHVWARRELGNISRHS